MDYPEPFPDNWTYLRTELNWLDRLLSTAVARQRKEVKEVDRVARSRADQATSHWWKGLLQIDGEVGGDSPAATSQRRSSTAKGNYQQQMESRIQVSQQREIFLGLPNLCQRLQLTTFEKNLVLMALAPEVSRRYGRIYSYLQETEQSGNSGLPTVDLVLRLLCRNDAEWRKARLLLTAQSNLIRYELVRLPCASAEPFLMHPVKLVDPLVEYLLADQPQPAVLEGLLQNGSDSFLPIAPLPIRDLESWASREALAAIAEHPAIAENAENEEFPAIAAQPLRFFTVHNPSLESAIDPWASLVLPAPLLQQLQHLVIRLKHAGDLDKLWSLEAAPMPQSAAGTVVLLVGASGTGKTMAAQAIAQATSRPLFHIDLAQISPTDQPAALKEMALHAPTIALIQSAQHWFGRVGTLSPEGLRQWLQDRQQQPGITLLSVERKDQITPLWQRRMSAILEFPAPNKASRSRLWHQAFPSQLALSDDIDWRSLADLPLSGGTIQAIARDAALGAIAESPPAQLAMRHLVYACALHKLTLKIKASDRQSD